MAAPGRRLSEGAACGRHTAHVRVCRRAVKPHERAHPSLAMYPHRSCRVAVPTARAQQSINIRTVRARTTTTAARNVTRTLAAHVPSEVVHCLSSRYVLTHSLTCVAERAATDHFSSANHRADEQLACGASRSSSRTTAQPMARSAPA